jgi:hypothetical protein
MPNQRTDLAAFVASPAVMFCSMSKAINALKDKFSTEEVSVTQLRGTNTWKVCVGKTEVTITPS